MMRTSGRLRRWFLGYLLPSLGVLLAFSSALSAGTGPAAWSARWRPATLVNGSPVLFRIAPPEKLSRLSGTWLGHTVFFSLDPKARLWYGIAGVGLETKPGLYTLELSGVTRGGKPISFEKRIAVKKAVYPSIAVVVAKQFTEPSAEQLKETASDKIVKQDVFGRITPDRQWAGNFLPPVNARISDVFGTQRTFNGVVQGTPHQGLDFAVPAGTPVAALNRGTVVLARFMFFEGNCVIIDHGQGLMSLYLHFSQIKVREGDQVERGQEIGLSGGTGRATGPHLHVAVRWQGVYVSPAILLAMQLP